MTADDDRYIDPVWAAVLAVWAGCILFSGLNDRASLDDHEVLVAQSAREMLEHGDWTHPTFNGEPRYQKPPLAYWLVMVCYQCTGVDRFAVRFPSAFSSFIGTLALGAWATIHFGQRVGAVAILMQCTTYWMLEVGKAAEIDGTLMALVSLAILLTSADRWPIAKYPAIWPAAVLLFWTLIGLSSLAKGPVGPCVILLVALAYRGLRRRESGDRWLWLHPASVIGVALAAWLSLAWAWTIYRENPGVLSLWWAQSVERFQYHWGPQTKPWYYYFYEIPALTFPWTAAWLIGMIAAYRRRQFSDAHKLLSVWIVIGTLFFTLSAGKRMHYILPVLPPFSVWAALGFEALFPRNSPANARRSYRLAFALGFGAVLVVPILETQVLPRLLLRRGTEDMIQRQRAVLDAAPAVWQVGSRDQSLIFPINRPMRFIAQREPISAEHIAGITQPGVVALVTPERLDELTGLIASEIIDQADAVWPVDDSYPVAWYLVRAVHPDTAGSQQ